MKTKILLFALLLNIFFLASCESHLLSSKSDDDSTKDDSKAYTYSNELSEESQIESEDSLVSLPFVPVE